MPFIGAGIQAAKGISDVFLGKKKLKELQDIDSKDLLELVPLKKRTASKLRLKQVEYTILLAEEGSRKDLSKIEEEMLELMQQNISEKRDELINKPATQFDIANILMNLQKISHETANEMDEVKNDSTKKALNIEEFKKGMSGRYDNFSRDISKKFDNTISEVEHRTENMEKELKLHREQTQKDISICMGNFKIELSESFETFKSGVEAMLQSNNKRMENEIQNGMSNMQSRINTFTSEAEKNIESFKKDTFEQINAYKQSVDRLSRKINIFIGITGAAFVMALVYIITKSL